MFSGRPQLPSTPRVRERRRAERERYARCEEGFEHVLSAAEESIDPILRYLRRDRGYARRRGDE